MRLSVLPKERVSGRSTLGQLERLLLVIVNGWSVVPSLPFKFCTLPGPRGTLAMAEVHGLPRKADLVGPLDGPQLRLANYLEALLGPLSGNLPTHAHALDSTQTTHCWLARGDEVDSEWAFVEVTQ